MGIAEYFLSSHPEVLIGEGWVYHGRPMKHSFKYSIFNLLMPLHHPNAINVVNRLPFFGINSADYLDGKNGDLFRNAQDFLKENLNFTPQKIWLQTLPRIFGYSFNPISFWFCYSDTSLEGILCEVNNTFGDRHFYYIKCIHGVEYKTFTLPKRFHVSPFFPISGSYTFGFEKTNSVSDIKIRLSDQGTVKLDTRLMLNLAPLSRKTHWQILNTYKWLTVAVIVRIHIQALKLWIKGAKFFRRPQPPQEKFTL